MLDKVKRSLGIRSDAYDEELTVLIASAKADLRLSGITIPENDPLLLTAVAYYCQANRGTDTDRRQAFLKMYRAQKRDFWMAHEYTGAGT